VLAKVDSPYRGDARKALTALGAPYEDGPRQEPVSVLMACRTSVGPVPANPTLSLPLWSYRSDLLHAISLVEKGDIT